MAGEMTLEPLSQNDKFDHQVTVEYYTKVMAVASGAPAYMFQQEGSYGMSKLAAIIQMYLAERKLESARREQ